MWDSKEGAEAVFWTDLSGKLAEDAPSIASFSHSVSRSAINHIRERHGSAEREAKRGQLAVKAADVARIPEIVTGYDAIRTDLETDQGSQRIAYAKAVDDGVIVLIEDVSNKRKDMRAVSMWKFPPTADPRRLLDSSLQGGVKMEEARKTGLLGDALRSLPDDESGAQAPSPRKSVGPERGELNQSGTESDAEAARREHAETERAYGGREAYEAAKAAGQTKLNFFQWVQVRTPRFKQWLRTPTR